eukprot:COSAG05_NODE_15161_length_377_cov_0.553957_1_plen_24_part_01
MRAYERYDKNLYLYKDPVHPRSAA